jgi:hypothetical protein
MSQHYPQEPGWGQQQPGPQGAPQQPQPQQPGWGAPPPGWGAPPPQPPRKSSVGKVIGFTALGLVGLILLLGFIGAASDSGSDDAKKSDSVSAADDSKDTGKDPAAEEPASEKPAQEAPAEEEAASDIPVEVTAKKTAFAKSILAEGSDYTSVLVTISNNGDEPIDVNPLYFSITDSNGSKHTAELAVDENQMDTVDLAPGENISGTITGKGTFTPKYVTYTDGILGDPIRGNVS